MKRAARLVVCFALGCGDETSPQPEPNPPEAQGCPDGRSCDFDMDLGVGLYDFEAIAPGDEVKVTLGPQGGFHIWLATRCRDCSKQVLIEYGIRGSADDSWLVGQPLRGIVNMDQVGGWQQVTGLYGLLPGTPDTVDYVGLSLHLEATIEDGERSASRVLPVHVAEVEVWDCPENDPALCAE